GRLRLGGAAGAADRLLDARGRILGALDTGLGGRDEHGAARLPDGERGAGVDADERLLEGHRIRGVLGDQSRHAVVDRLQPQLRALAGRCGPAPVVDSPEAPAAFVDYPVPACSRSRIDADDLHEDTLGTPAEITGQPWFPPITAPFSGVCTRALFSEANGGVGG